MGWVNKDNGKKYQEGGNITSSMSVVGSPIKERRMFDWDKKKKKKKKNAKIR